MTTSKEKISPIIPGTPVSTTTTTDSKTTKGSGAGTTKKSSTKGSSDSPQIKTKDDVWQKNIAAAHKVWRELSENELKKSAGDPDKLAELVQTRYSISRSEAEKQVKDFIAKQN